MNYSTTYRKALAVSLLLLIFSIDIAAVYFLFNNLSQVFLFGAVLGVQTLLILEYHRRCLECPGCMEKAGSGIYLFYKVFGLIGCVSLLLILLGSMLTTEGAVGYYLKIMVALTYAVLLISGVSTAFKAVIGVRNFSECAPGEKKTSSKNVNTATASADLNQDKIGAAEREQATLDAWQLKKEQTLAETREFKQRREIRSKEAAQRKKVRNEKRRKFPLPDISSKR